MFRRGRKQLLSSEFVTYKHTLCGTKEDRRCERSVYTLQYQTDPKGKLCVCHYYKID